MRAFCIDMLVCLVGGAALATALALTEPSLGILVFVLVALGVATFLWFVVRYIRWRTTRRSDLLDAAEGVHMAADLVWFLFHW